MSNSFVHSRCEEATEILGSHKAVSEAEQQLLKLLSPTALKAFIHFTDLLFTEQVEHQAACYRRGVEDFKEVMS